MKTIDLLNRIFDDNKILVSSSIASIFSKKELCDFVISAQLICGRMKEGDYFVSENPLNGEIADAVFRSFENGTMIYCYSLE
jgi:hypothetical protein